MASKTPSEDAQAVGVYGGRGNPSPPAFRPVLSAFPRIRTAKDARKAYGRIIAAFTRGEIAGDDAKTLAYLLSGYLQACTASEFEERIEALERNKK